MYAELHCKSNYSFLTGASHADELIERAVALGYSALAITDENTLAGIVRAYAAVREANQTTRQEIDRFKLIIGAEIIPRDAPPVVLWATDRKSYANLSRLITVGRRRAPKGECWLELADIAEYSDGLLAGVIPHFTGDRSRIGHIDPDHPSWPWFERALQGVAVGVGGNSGESHYKDLFGDRAYLLASLYRGIDDDYRIGELEQRSRQTGLPLVAAGDVLYHHRSRLPLHDVLTATKYHTTVAMAEHLLLPNSDRHLQTIQRRQTAFARIPAALQRTLEITDRCHFCLSQLRYEYPEELAPPGQTPFQYLQELTEAGLRQRYPQGVSSKVRQQVQHELKLIKELRYEAYFLTVWDLVRFARQRGILCQGRGSAANSAVCYCLGVTSVDPATSDLLFERFISKERDEAPDIDVDFEHERREEVLQYLYEKYGRDRAGLAATVITYRMRSAVRDVGKALGLSLDRVDALAKQFEGDGGRTKKTVIEGTEAVKVKTDSELSRVRLPTATKLQKRMSAVGIDPDSEIGKRLDFLVNELLGFPRHLSQHVGGMVITRGRLDELVPVENASMDDRTVIQWDKNDLEELGLLKVDCLCLGMLSAIRKCFHLVDQHWHRSYTLSNLPPEDPHVYDMICAADTIGVFQIESRGQMSMLPRLKPRCWYDLVIEVAIMRPGPIQGNMVHPYLRRRNGEEPVNYPNEAIKSVLHRTLGVPIFQEQAMKLAVVAAGFTPGEADQLRRAMGKWRKTGLIQKFHDQLIDGMRERGLTGEFAEQVFQQISGFGEYGFPESHAASFAKLVYVSAWLKCYYPAAFCAALINSQPMGFYAPAQLVADAQRHGVEVLPVDVNHSDWNCTIESRCSLRECRSSLREQSEYSGSCSVGDDLSKGERMGGHARRSETDDDNCEHPLRLGFRLICGLRAEYVDAIISARRGGPFTSVSDFTLRTGLGQSVIAQLSGADAFGTLNQNRRAALWQALAQEKKPRDQPLFASLEISDDDTFALPTLAAVDEVTADYRSVGLSLKAHPMSFHRESLNQISVTPCGQLADKANHRQVRVAGLVIMRQRPSTAKGITFVTLEDETGVANLIVKPDLWERHFQIAKTSAAWVAHGKLEMRSNVIHIVVNKLESLAERLGEVEMKELEIKPRDFR